MPREMEGNGSGYFGLIVAVMAIMLLVTVVRQYLSTETESNLQTAVLLGQPVRIIEPETSEEGLYHRFRVERSLEISDGLLLSDEILNADRLSFQFTLDGRKNLIRHRIVSRDSPPHVFVPTDGPEETYEGLAFNSQNQATLGKTTKLPRTSQRWQIIEGQAQALLDRFRAP
jgi:hypothetical protein